jgi:hypothetical protein
MRTTPRTAVALTGSRHRARDGLAGCSNSSPSTATKPTSAPANMEVGVLLPDTASSPALGLG